MNALHQQALTERTAGKRVDISLFEMNGLEKSLNIEALLKLFLNWSISLSHKNGNIALNNRKGDLLKTFGILQ